MKRDTQKYVISNKEYNTTSEVVLLLKIKWINQENHIKPLYVTKNSPKINTEQREKH